MRKAPWQIAAALIVLLASTPAHAYLDPGTGSMIIQGLIGAVAAGLFLLRGWWQRLLSLRPGARKAADRPEVPPESTSN